jgi:hypothetical protein
VPPARPGAHVASPVRAWSNSLSCGSTRRTSSKAPKKPSSAVVDTALPSHELVQRLGIRLVRCRVPHHPRPLASSALVGLGRVGGAPNDRGKRVFPIRDFQPPQPERPASSVHVTAFRGPPGHQAVHRGQVRIDRVCGPGWPGSLPKHRGPVAGRGAGLQPSTGRSLLATVLVEMFPLKSMASL